MFIKYLIKIRFYRNGEHCGQSTTSEVAPVHSSEFIFTTNSSYEQSSVAASFVPTWKVKHGRVSLKNPKFRLFAIRKNRVLVHGVCDVRSASEIVLANPIGGTKTKQQKRALFEVCFLVIFFK